MGGKGLLNAHPKPSSGSRGNCIIYICSLRKLPLISLMLSIFAFGQVDVHVEYVAVEVPLSESTRLIFVGSVSGNARSKTNAYPLDARVFKTIACPRTRFATPEQRNPYAVQTPAFLHVVA